LVILVVLVLANSGDGSNSQPNASSLVSAVSAPSVTQLAANQELVIPAGSVQSFQWDATQAQPNCRVTGHIEVTDGGAKDVQVAIMPGDDYQNFVNGHEAKVFFQTDKKTAVTLDVNTGQVGLMVLAISNAFSLLTEKKVSLTGLQAVCR
jgi:hypothetical protein